jgi:WD40 repeat protein
MMNPRVLALLVLAAAAAMVRAQDAAEPLQGFVIRRLGDVNWRSTFDLHAPAFSPDGGTLAFGGKWHIGLWKMSSGARLHSYERSGCGAFGSLAWAPDGSLYAGGENVHVMRWDPKTHKLVQEYEWHKSAIRRISLSADGARLTSLDAQGKVAVWEMPGGRVVRTFALPRSTWPDAVLSPDAKWLAGTGSREQPVLIFDVASGDKKHALNDGANHNFLKFAVTPDSKRLIGGGQGVIFIWDVEGGTLLHRLRNVGGDHVEALAVSPDGKWLAVVDWRQSVHLWDLQTGRVRRTLSAGVDRLIGVTFSPDSAIVVAGGGGCAIHRWRVDTGEALAPRSGHSGSVEGVAWLRNGRVLTAGLDRTLRFWNPDTEELEKVVALPVDLIPKAFSADGTLLIATSEEHLHLVDTKTGTEKKRLPQRLDGAAQVAISPDGAWFAHPTGTKELRLSPAQGDDAPRVLATPARRVLAAVFSPDGMRLAVGFEEHLKEPFRPLDAGKKPPPRFTESRVFLYDVKSGGVIEQFGEQIASAVRLTFSPDGRYLAVGDVENRVHVWDLRLRKKMPAAIEHAYSPTFLAFSPDGRWLATLARMSGTGFDLYEVMTMKRIANFPGHALQTAAIAFSPDSRRIVSGGRDELALVWDVTRMAPHGQLPQLELSDAQIRDLWPQLGEPQASRAHVPLWQLIAAGDRSVDFLKQKLRATPHLNPKDVENWIERLDHPRFALRQEATKQLEALGEVVEQDLRKRLAQKPALEMRQRIQRLLDKLGPTPERLRWRRALCVLEHIGSPAAQRLLQDLSAGEPRDTFTEDVRASLARLRLRK